MLLRISLIVALAASIGTLVLSHVQVAGKINTLQTDLANTQQQLSRTQSDLAKARRDAQAAKDLADKTAKELERTQQELQNAQQWAQQQRQRADRAEKELNRVRTDLTKAQRDLAAWQVLGVPVEEIQNRLAELVKARETIAALQQENQLLLRKANNLRTRLMVYEGEQEPKVELPEGLKGKVIAVDPKWDFVVLDIGGKQGVLERGEMLVSRDGKLVAKVRITRVEEDRSIANVLPEWKQADVRVGDVVIY